MTQGFPAQPQYGQTPPQQYAPPMPQGYAPPAQPQYTQPAPVPQYQQGMGAAPGGFFQTQDPYVQAQQGPAVPPAPQPSAVTQTDTTGFWGGAPSLSFDAAKGYVKGTFRGGQVLSKTISDQTDMATKKVRTWADGSPRKQMVLLLQTGERADPQDNGQRQLFIKGDLPRACREAFQATGASDIEIGSWVYAAWIDEKPSQAGGHPTKIYKVAYARPGQPDPMAGQPAYQPNPVPAPMNQVPVPQPGQGADQFAEYAAYQQQMAAHQAAAPPAGVPQYAAPPVPEQPQVIAPQGPPFGPSAFAQATAPQPQQFAPQPGGQPPATGVPQPQQPNPQGQQPQWSPFA